MRGPGELWVIGWLKPVVELNIDTKKEEHDDHKFYQTLEQDNAAIEKLEENKKVTMQELGK